MSEPAKEKIFNQMMPLSKSVANRLMILSLIDKDNSYLKFLESFDNKLPDDIEVCKYVMESWYECDWIDVGESRTALIFLKELAKTTNQKKFWSMKGNLPNRPLDNTSQTTSARLLCGEIIPENQNEPYHVRLTRNIMARWKRGERYTLFNQIDDTIWEQCMMMEIVALKGVAAKFKCNSAEDVCLAYFLSVAKKIDYEYQMTLESIVREYATSLGHESVRPIDLLTTYIQIHTGKPITSKDHRVIMASSFYAMIQNIEVSYENPECVDKSFPYWWKYLDLLKQKKGLIV